MALKRSPSSKHQHCTDEAEKAETVLSAVIYIYIYIYRQVLEVRQWGQLLTGPTRFNNVSAVQPSSDKI